MGNRFREKVVEEGLVEETVETRRTVNQSEENDDTVDEEILESQQMEDAKEEEPKRPRKSDKLARGVGKVLGGDILGDKMVLKQIRLLLLCLFFLLLLVANRYDVKISQIAEDLSESGVGITSGPPYEIEK